MARGEKSAELRLRTCVGQFYIGQTVRLRLDGAEGTEGMVTAVRFMIGAEYYTVGWSDRESTEHAGIELVASADPDRTETDTDG